MVAPGEAVTFAPLADGARLPPAYISGGKTPDALMMVNVGGFIVVRFARETNIPLPGHDVRNRREFAPGDQSCTT